MIADLIVANIGQLVTCASPHGPKRGSQMAELGLLEDAAIAVTDGMLVGIGNSRVILDKFDASETIDANGRAVVPGFVDPHTHIVFAGNRLDEFELKIRGAEYLEILASGGGILSTVRQTRAATQDELVSEALSRLDKMLTSGTTTCEIKTGYGLDTVSELKMLRVIEELDSRHTIEIIPTFLAAHTVPAEFKNDPEGYIEHVCEDMLPQAWDWYRSSRFADDDVPFFCDVFTERNAFDLDQSRRLFETARSLGFAIKAHVDQFTNLGGSGLGVQSSAVSIDHLDMISEKEIQELSASNTIGVVIPTESFSGGKTWFAPARALVDSGCAVAISTDYNPGSAPCPSMPMAMAIACRYQKLLPAEALNAATINAAHAIGMGDRLGSIEIGKQADLIILDSADHRQIAYEFGRSPVETVIKRGKVVYPIAEK